MKTLIILLSLISTPIFAETYMTYENKDFSIKIFVDRLETLPTKSQYIVYDKFGSQVQKGKLTKEFEGYEGSFLNAYIWVFSDSLDNSIAVGVREMKTLTKGIWEGSADVFISVQRGVFSGSTIDCEVEVY